MTTSCTWFWAVFCLQAIVTIGGFVALVVTCTDDRGCLIGKIMLGFFGFSFLLITPFMWWPIAAQGESRRKASAAWSIDRQQNGGAHAGAPLVSAVQIGSAPPQRQRQRSRHYSGREASALQHGGGGGGGGGGGRRSRPASGRDFRTTTTPNDYKRAKKNSHVFELHEDPPPSYTTVDMSPSAPPVDDGAGAAPEGDTECVICMNAQRQVAFVPCGHVATCKACSALVRRQCPICRQHIESVLDVHIA